MDLDPDITSVVSLAEFDEFNPAELPLNFDMPDLTPYNNSTGIEAADVGSLLEQFEEASNSLTGFEDLKMSNETKTTEKLIELAPPEKSNSKDVLLKIKASNKRKSVILLPMGMPSKRGRGQAIALKPTSTTPRLQRILQKSSTEVSQSILESMEKYSLKKQPPCTASDILAEEKTSVSKNYYRDILDHDYCQNVPKLEGNKAQTGVNCHPGDILDLEDGEIIDEFDDVEIEKDKNSTNIIRDDFKNKQNVAIAKDNVSNKPSDSQQKGQKFSGRNYRKREESPVGKEDDKFFDKIPSYYTALSLNGVKQSKSKKENIAPKEDSNGGITIQDFFEPNPIPQGDNSVYSRLPAYHSCFTNSTKYDNNDVSLESKSSSGYSSRSRSPYMSQRSSSRSVSRNSSRSRSRDCDRRGRRRRRSGTYDSIVSRSRSRSYGSSYSRSSRSRSRSYSRSRSGSYSSRSRSSSVSSRSRSRSRSYSRHRGYRSRSRSSSHERRLAERQKRREEERAQKMKDRRIIYVGKIPNNYTKRQLRKRFECFGEIEEVSVHFRECGDNYGFVTFAYTCDAYAAVEKGNQVPGALEFDLCFGGRRQFCEVEYADLDGKNEVIEEYYPLVRKSDPVDFDSLLQQARKLAEEKKKKAV
ncbi:peroxisome proliferator-activated receptor gamma coactivator 1-alpha-like [Saccostrea echinata]|uniref:peroxisome proliferator-activated receptor gamma coactivator 1-alpha-like n=1 Tax=Saccostrea echinata TaxID=191078 RepID=UPI002A7FC272|nr:peroxisome proliferator-activated receptor gamma coactivator 1-alpha-like [Saccostrea echinata]